MRSKKSRNLILTENFFSFQVWNFVAFLCYVGAGSVAIYTWTNANSTDTKGKNYDAALSMGALCIVNGIVYFVDFIISRAARNRYLQDQY